MAFDIWLKPQSSEPPSLPVCEKPSFEVPRDGSISQNMWQRAGRWGGLSGSTAALVYSFFCLNWKKKNRVLWELVKEYLRSILSSHSLLHLYMSVFNIYISLLNWIVLLALSSSMCLKDKRVSCNVDEVIYCIRVNLFVKTDGVISCELSKSFCIDNCQSCFYQTRLWLTIKDRLFSQIKAIL